MTAFLRAADDRPHLSLEHVVEPQALLSRLRQRDLTEPRLSLCPFRCLADGAKQGRYGQIVASDRPLLYSGRSQSELIFPCHGSRSRSDRICAPEIAGGKACGSPVGGP
jgi:hypothetical protein